MLVTFTTEAYADITMFGDVGLAMLKMMGHSATVPGAIRAEDVPAALERLKAAVDTNPSTATTANKDDDEPNVSLRNRALPLIELLTAAVRDNTYVTWK